MDNAAMNTGVPIPVSSLLLILRGIPLEVELVDPGRMLHLIF